MTDKITEVLDKFARESGCKSWNSLTIVYELRRVGAEELASLAFEQGKLSISKTIPASWTKDDLLRQESNRKAFKLGLEEGKLAERKRIFARVDSEFAIQDGRFVNQYGAMYFNGFERLKSQLSRGEQESKSARPSPKSDGNASGSPRNPESFPISDWKGRKATVSFDKKKVK